MVTRVVLLPLLLGSVIDKRKRVQIGWGMLSNSIIVLNTNNASPSNLHLPENYNQAQILVGSFKNVKRLL